VCARCTATALAFRTFAAACVAGCLATCAAGCGLTRLQTARPVPRGVTQFTIAQTLVDTGDRGTDLGGVTALPIEMMVRHGITERGDWGVRNFFGLGLLLDTKWNLLSPQRRTALSLSAGFGAAADQGAVIHVPITVSASHSVRPWFTPYAAVGYGTYWIFDYKQPEPGVTYASRSGTGDGLLMLHAGIDLSGVSGRGVLFEYSVGFPVVNDPGDFYGFATNQFFSIAYHTGTGRGGKSAR
jgi:hypothetical protein